MLLLPICPAGLPFVPWIRGSLRATIIELASAHFSTRIAVKFFVTTRKWRSEFLSLVIPRRCSPTRLVQSVQAVQIFR